jgi:uncharacterized protein (TIGR03084 family)
MTTDERAAPSVTSLCDDLRAERHELDTMVASLSEDEWKTATPAEGWTITDQFTHLAWFDDAARQSIEDPDGFRHHREHVLRDVDAFVARTVAMNHDRPGIEVRNWLNRSGSALIAGASVAAHADRLPWYGPDMSLASCITARIMETWAHGQDVADALAQTRQPTSRLAHVAFIGWRAVPNSFRANHRPVPDEPVRVELTGLEEVLVFGPDAAQNTVVGSLLDLCLVVTQRRHRRDTDLVASGRIADEWLDIAQAFAGPPGAGRQPGQFAAPLD